MTTDKEYSDMGICPECLSQDYDGGCRNCGYVSMDGFVFMDDVQWPNENRQINNNNYDKDKGRKKTQRCN